MTSKRPRFTTASAPTYVRDRHRLSPDEMLELLNSFPSTNQIIDSWDPVVLDALGKEIWKDLSHSLDPAYLPFEEDEDYWDFPVLPSSMMTLSTIRFVLSIWNDKIKWQSGSESVTRTLLDIWDAEHREAFLEWAKAPKAP